MLKNTSRMGMNLVAVPGGSEATARAQASLVRHFRIKVFCDFGNRISCHDVGQ